MKYAQIILIQQSMVLILLVLNPYLVKCHLFMTFLSETKNNNTETARNI